MPDENIIPDALPDVSQLNTPDAAGTVGSVPSGAITLSEINEKLGKQFPNMETAVKALKDTFSYVGKKKEDIEREVLSSIQNVNKTEELAKEIANMRKDQFYDRNPQYASLRGVIEKMGDNPSDVVNQAEFKDIYTKVSGYDESQKLRTVLESNPRLTSSRDNLAKAQELQSKGANSADVDAAAVQAVKDAFDL